MPMISDDVLDEVEWALEAAALSDTVGAWPCVKCAKAALARLRAERGK